MTHQDRLRARHMLQAHGIPGEIADLVTIGTDPGMTNDAPDRGRIGIAYADATGTKRETAIMSTGSIEEMWDVISNREAIGALIALGLRAIPAARRPIGPDWIERSATARRTTAGLGRARRLADDAALGKQRPVNHDDDGPADSPLQRELRKGD